MPWTLNGHWLELSGWGHPVPEGELFGTVQNRNGQISYSYLVPNISFNFKDAVCPCVCTTHKLQDRTGNAHTVTGPPARGDPVIQLQVDIPLKPLPPALDPFPNLRCLRHQPSQSRQQTQGGHWQHRFCNFFFGGDSLSMLNRCCLMAGCLGRQVSTFLPYRGGRRGRPGTQGVEESRVGFKNKNL